MRINSIHIEPTASQSRSHNDLLARKFFGNPPIQFLYICLFISALSFVTQPTYIRIFNYPVTLPILLIFSVYCSIFGFKWQSNLRFLLLLYPAFLIVSDVIFGVGYRGSVFALLLITTILSTGLQIEEKQMLRLWGALAASCTVLTLIGFFRYFNGYEAPLSENSSGVLGVAESYIYLGISYLPATRNSDAFYFLAGTFAVSRLILSSKKTHPLLAALCLFLLAATILSLARWAVIALMIFAIVALTRRQLVFVTIIAASISVVAMTFLLATALISESYAQLLGELIWSGLLSIFNPDSANMRVSGYYTYSNDERIGLLSDTLSQFLKWPFGYGMDNPDYIHPSVDTNRIHSENLFLDMLIIFGIFCLPIVILFFAKVAQVWRIRYRSVNARVACGVLLSCVIFAALNSPADFVIFWFVLVLAFAEANLAVRKSLIERLRVNGRGTMSTL